MRRHVDIRAGHADWLPFSLEVGKLHADGTATVLFGEELEHQRQRIPVRAHDSLLVPSCPADARSGTASVRANGPERAAEDQANA